MDDLRISASWAHDAVVRSLGAVGVPADHAEIVADQLIAADLRGVDTHGLLRLPVYVRRIRSGELEPSVQPEVVAETTSTGVVDGKHGLGQVASHAAMEVAIGKAKEHGVAVVTVRNSSHFGAAAGYTMMAADRGCIGMAATNTWALLPAVGGASRAVGNNPLSIAVPSGEGFPLVLDIAMSQVAAGNLRMAAAAGESIPLGWAFDKHGEPTTDPVAALWDQGMLRPIADHKGFGLAFMVEVLTGVLAGGAVGSDVVGLDGEGYAQVSHWFLALDIATFLDPGRFGEGLDAFVSQIRGGRRRAGVDRLLVPGEPEHLTRQDREVNGIPYSASTLSAVREVAAEVGLDLAEPVVVRSDGGEGSIPRGESKGAAL